MSEIKTASELAAACLNVAQNYKTLYVMGCFGAPLNAENKERYTQNHEYNRQTVRTVKIKSAASNTFGFDCCGLIKGILWGWSGDTSKRYGGASYTSNNVPDRSADQMIKLCAGVTSDFSDIVPGEIVWTAGHVGVYVGNGLAVECTPAWGDCVQVTAVHNIGKKSGYNGRKWSKHGKLPYVSYTAAAEPTPAPAPSASSKNESAALTVQTLKRGSTGAAVKAMQILLIGNGHSCGSAGVDGSYGPDTEKAVKAYQAATGKPVDGVADPDTLGSLYGLK